MAKEKGILVRFTASDHEAILKKAEQFNVSVSVLLNRLGLEKELPTTDEKDTFLQIIYLLDRNANNINQIATALNSARKHGTPASVTEKEILTAALEARNLHSNLKKLIKTKWQS
jgi:predicted transcriptional regulator